jgi:hypothetical protein
VNKALTLRSQGTMISMDLPGQLLSGKKVTISKRRERVIERVWLDVWISSLVTNMFVGWVTVTTVLIFMRERAVYGGLYVTSRLVGILSNSFLGNFHDHCFPLCLKSAAVRSLHGHYSFPQSPTSSCIPNVAPTQRHPYVWA